ncbi:MAG: hypothetical protein Phog2KO_49890 [Phototrophicaceae bacterium]
MGDNVQVQEDDRRLGGEHKGGKSSGEEGEGKTVVVCSMGGVGYQAHPGNDLDVLESSFVGR